MHFSGFNFNQIMWTLTFAALLVLLVVLLGRDRARRYPWFTASMVLTALRLLASRMLYGRLAPLTMSSIFLTLAVVEALVTLLVAVEIARRAFVGASRRAWIIGTLALLAVGAAVLAEWGPWPAWKTLTAESTLAILRLTQLVAQKASLLSSVLTVGLGLLVVLFGRRFKAGWRSHTQQIVIGLSTAAIAQMAFRGIWQAIALHAAPQSQAEYERVMSIQEKLYNANSVVFVAVLVWWIVCLWINEPESELPAAAEASSPGDGSEAGKGPVDAEK
ncbi:MAG: hypothetical protein WA802_15630 [Terracidiphilus sp.]